MRAKSTCKKDVILKPPEKETRVASGSQQPVARTNLPNKFNEMKMAKMKFLQQQNTGHESSGYSSTSSLPSRMKQAPNPNPYRSSARTKALFKFIQNQKRMLHANMRQQFQQNAETEGEIEEFMLQNLKAEFDAEELAAVDL